MSQTPPAPTTRVSWCPWETAPRQSVGLLAPKWRESLSEARPTEVHIRAPALGKPPSLPTHSTGTFMLTLQSSCNSQIRSREDTPRWPVVDGWPLWFLVSISRPRCLCQYLVPALPVSPSCASEVKCPGKKALWVSAMPNRPMREGLRSSGTH